MLLKNSGSTVIGYAILVGAEYTVATTTNLVRLVNVSFIGSYTIEDLVGGFSKP